METEVSALKALVLTSTPSQPNKHLHPQLMSEGKKSKLGRRQSNNGGSSESVASSNSNSYMLVSNGSPVYGGHR